ncbi:hypothetical protein QBC47DRAFT_418928 [Echria macrotheca]|uniref:Ubiquitin-like protease family profile domain-containing protein n=1 Tax=Echria macrotheca TaxID=438768 RepID=A0AAJ0B0R1_9PEZI|nr:hypothetical protein QBC47DRAFT_418928 [Echria macrotheca]
MAPSRESGDSRAKQETERCKYDAARLFKIEVSALTEFFGVCSKHFWITVRAMSREHDWPSVQKACTEAREKRTKTNEKWAPADLESAKMILEGKEEGRSGRKKEARTKGKEVARTSKKRVSNQGITDTQRDSESPCEEGRHDEEGLDVIWESGNDSQSESPGQATPIRATDGQPGPSCEKSFTVQLGDEQDSRISSVPDNQPEPRSDGADVADNPQSTDNSIITQEGNSFRLVDGDLETLQPGQWLNDTVVTGALHLLSAIDDRIVVIDSLALGSQQMRRQAISHDAKVFFPIYINGNHWILGVYKRRSGLVVYDSLPKPVYECEAAVWSKFSGFYSRFLKRNGYNPDRPKITITFPFCQKNSDDCGVYCIIAAFREAVALSIEPEDIDPALWRAILLCILGPATSHGTEVDTQTERFRLDAPLSELLDALFTQLNERRLANDQMLAAAECSLGILRRARQLVESRRDAVVEGDSAGVRVGDRVRNATLRFQRGFAYCEARAKSAEDIQQEIDSTLELLRSGRKRKRSLSADVRAHLRADTIID